MSFLNLILESTKEVESPKEYFYWSGITALSAVLGRKVWLNRRNLYKLRPNTYTFLVSKRSGLRKSPPVTMCRKLMHMQGGIRIIDGQNSIQGVLKELSQVCTTPTQQIISEAEGLLISGEFANFLIMDREASPLTSLTDLYDTHNYEDGWSKRLVSQDKIKLKGLCLNGLFASNEVHFRDAVPDNAIRGGFLARCFVVYAEKRQTLNSLLADTEEEEEEELLKCIPYEELVEHLNKVYKLQGEFRVENAARKFYNEWYYEFARKEIDDETGTTERVGDTILKAAMCIAVAEKPELIINLSAMEEAITKSIECVMGTRKLTFMGSQNDIRANILRTITSTLLSAPEYTISRKVLIRKGLGIFDTLELDQTVDQLVQGGMVESSHKGGEIYLKLKDWVVERYGKIEGMK